MLLLDNLDCGGNQLVRPVLDNEAANPAAPKAGQMYFNTADKRVYYYDGAAWQRLQVADVVRVLDKTTATATFNALSTTATTTIYSYTLPGNTLGAASGLRTSIRGDYFCNGATSATWQMGFVFGTHAIWQATTPALAVSAVRGAWWATFELANLAALGQQVMTGQVVFSTRVAPSLGEGSFGFSNSVSFTLAVPFGTVTNDVTLDNLLQLQVTPSLNSVNMEITRQFAFTELIP